ncbi:hypothetical protein COLAER_01896 [Collinsella aerofaciens ATCC 25986]|uniref:Uncharacterized protein n=1 Tax=Collinsella aerofaciens (strain ATCC 25986 / DSM 3979 / JCM 10188 / KCTC 3647 / NCTC 11838 / VPI 1003) TaxID=411903 RepID=A4EBS5_COLAA|nr:hypothetical protein COLAER_01896 [Collinsella aerofaciens ATCC 25986]
MSGKLRQNNAFKSFLVILLSVDLFDSGESSRTSLEFVVIVNLLSDRRTGRHKNVSHIENPNQDQRKRHDTDRRNV